MQEWERWGGGGEGRGGRVCVEGNSAEKGESKRMEKDIFFLI